MTSVEFQWVVRSFYSQVQDVGRWWSIGPCDKWNGGLFSAGMSKMYVTEMRGQVKKQIHKFSEMSVSFCSQNRKASWLRRDLQLLALRETAQTWTAVAETSVQMLCQLSVLGAVTAPSGKPVLISHPSFSQVFLHLQPLPPLLQLAGRSHLIPG